MVWTSNVRHLPKIYSQVEAQVRSRVVERVGALELDRIRPSSTLLNVDHHEFQPVSWDRNDSLQFEGRQSRHQREALSAMFI